MHKLWYSIGSALAFVTTTFAQISGKVTDQQQEPLMGVVVTIEGQSTKGTTTDFDGLFTLNAQVGDVLVVSYLGFKTEQVILKTQKQLHIILEEEAKQLEEILLVGSRTIGRTKTDSAVPVDIFDITKVSYSLPQVNINQILNSIAPSFTSTPQTAADGTDHLDPAQLRGLGPDQTLVLINGKRRHVSAFVNVNGTPGRGTVGTDLNAIPSFAVSKIEVLRDGAAAQYGSDAIAGVMNFSLKKKQGLSAQVSYGGNLTSTANDHRGGFDGEQTQLDLSYGLPLGKKGGFINFTLSGQLRKPTYRAGAYNGNIFNAYNAIEYRAHLAGDNLSQHFSNVNIAKESLEALIKQYAQEVSYLPSHMQNQIQQINITELQTLLKQDVTEEELAFRGLSRRDFNMHVGQSQLWGTQFFANTEIPLNNNWKIYAFGGQGYRHGQASGFYRYPYQARTFTGLYLNGFLPTITTNIIDSSLSVGIKGSAGEWSVDVSNTFGKNEFGYNIKNTSNTSLRFASPTQFDAGKLSFIQNTLNLDLTRPVNLLEKANLAFGAEYRYEAYGIKAGEEASYEQYDIWGNVLKPSTLPQHRPTNFLVGNRGIAEYLPAGAQGFSGFRKESELNQNRQVAAAYGEFEVDITRSLLANAAIRYEYYSDFGSTLNYKLATRLKLSPKLNFRAAASTGFRAPSIHQIYYTNIGTLYLNGDLQETGTFNNRSKTAKLFGIKELQEETSKSVSAGFTLTLPTAGLTLSADTYFIGVDNRITLTETFSRPMGNTPAEQELRAIFDVANLSAVQFFANAIDAQTKGLDLVINHQLKNEKFSLTNDLGLNISKTEKVGSPHTPAAIKNAGLESRFFSERALIYLEKAVPRLKATLSHNFTYNKWSAYLRNTYYGSTTTPDVVSVSNQMAGFKFDEKGHHVLSSKVITDVSASYALTSAMRLTLGVNNLFDLYPDKNIPHNNNNNQFVYSRSTSQFGFNGRYVFTRLNINLQ